MGQPTIWVWAYAETSLEKKRNTPLCVNENVEGMMLNIIKQ